MTRIYIGMLEHLIEKQNYIIVNKHYQGVNPSVVKIILRSPLGQEYSFFADDSETIASIFKH